MSGNTKSRGIVGFACGWLLACGTAAGQEACEVDILGIEESGGPVAMSGDFAVIGAAQDDELGQFAGAAFVFERQGVRWIQRAKLTASDGGPCDLFGAVDVDGDRIVVGAIRWEFFVCPVLRGGRAYVFRREGDTWIEEAQLVPSQSFGADEFGSSVSISGDRVLIGAPVGSADVQELGRAYVFRREGTNWIEEAVLIGSDTELEDSLGFAVSLSDDVALMGAPGDDDAGDRSGSAYVFRRQGTMWTQEAKLTASDAAPVDVFGDDASASGEHLLVTAPNNDDAGTNSGSAYVFRSNGATWSEQAKLTASDGTFLDRFGSSAAIQEDLIVVGATGDDDAGERSGAAYLFRRDGLGWVERQKLIGSDTDTNDRFAFGIAIADPYAGISGGGKTYMFAVENDCNDSGFADACDIVTGTSPDCNDNVVPDACEADCNGNAIPDDCDIADGSSPDCNENGVPDSCDLARRTSNDGNDNAIPDECEVFVPTVSHWGLVVMTSALAVTAKLCFKCAGQTEAKPKHA